MGEGSVFKVGDVVDLRDGAIICDERGFSKYIIHNAVPFSFAGGWVVEDVLHNDKGRVRGFVVKHKELSGYVDRDSILPIRIVQPKVANEVKFAVGDEVDLRPDALVKAGSISATPAQLCVSCEGWTILEKWSAFYTNSPPFLRTVRVCKEHVSGWVNERDLTPRPKLEPTQTVRVIETSEWVGMNGTHLRVRLTDEDSGVDVLFRADIANKTIHVGDEYAVTISKKDC